MRYRRLNHQNPRRASERTDLNRDLVAGSQLLRNVIEALCRALDEHPEGCLESTLWRGVEACGVAREVFDDAVDIMITAGRARRRGGRLFAGLVLWPEPRFR